MLSKYYSVKVLLMIKTISWVISALILCRKIFRRHRWHKSKHKKSTKTQWNKMEVEKKWRYIVSSIGSKRYCFYQTALAILDNACKTQTVFQNKIHPKPERVTKITIIDFLKYFIFLIIQTTDTSNIVLILFSNDAWSTACSLHYRIFSFLLTTERTNIGK